MLGALTSGPNTIILDYKLEPAKNGRHSNPIEQQGSETFATPLAPATPVNINTVSSMGNA